MDVGRHKQRSELCQRMLLFGVVTYASGQIGMEPIRSQGHIHKVSSHSGWSPPEVYEIWSGAAYIYMQESASDDPGRCYAVLAKFSELVIKCPEHYEHLGIGRDIPIYKQFEKDHEKFQWVSRPQLKKVIWSSFVP